MRRVLPASFFWQLVLGTFLAQTVLLSVFIIYTVVTQSEIAQQRTRQRIALQLNRLEAACAQQLADGDMKSLHSVLELSRIAPTIEVARITDLQGNTLAVSDGGKNRDLDAYERKALASGAQQQVFTIGNGQIEAVTPVVQNGKTLALLWLEPNHALSLNTLNTIVQISLTYGVFALLANLVPLFLITTTMTRPLQRLREATQDFSEGSNPAGSFPLPVTTSNEAGALTTSFNMMVGKLELQREGLLDTLALLDSMLANAPIGFAFFDGEHRCVRVNGFLARMFGTSARRSLGLTVMDIYPQSLGQEVAASITRVFEKDEAIRNLEMSGVLADHPDDSRTWLMSFYPVHTQEHVVKWVGTVIVETTEQRKAEEALRRTEKLAATGRLAASIAHEINNPLEAVTNLLYLLGTHDALDATARGFVSSAQSELARVSEITQQMLRFHRQSTFPGSISVTDVLTSVVSLYQSRLHTVGVTVTNRFRGDPEVFGYGGELRQVLANLIGNAIDAMPSGGQLLLRASRGCGRDLAGTWCEGVRVSVTDTGTGMDDATAEKIFEPFFTTKPVIGTGLGLWVSLEILRKHGATVRVRSRQTTKSGTTFMLFFPDNALAVSA